MTTTADSLRKFADQLDAGEKPEDIGPLLVLIGWSMMKRAKRSKRP